eukprot:323891-Rhodomonas_salina.1
MRGKRCERARAQLERSESKPNHPHQEAWNKCTWRLISQCTWNGGLCWVFAEHIAGELQSCVWFRSAISIRKAVRTKG